MSNNSTNKLVIGLAGLGTVGGGLVTLLQKNQDLIEQHTGRQIIVKKVLVHNLNKPRKVELPKGATLTCDFKTLTDDPEIKAIVEVMGGLSPAKELIYRALDQGKDVVTANKALLAEEGLPLFAKAQEKNKILRYEASVAGAIPIVQTLKESLASNRILALIGILNGTSNYILSQMTAKELSFQEALKEAQNLGFAEADPSLDIDGFDAAHKLCLLIRLAFGVHYDFKAMPVEGIRNISPLDIHLANELGYHIKLIGQVRVVNFESKEALPKLEAGVYPALIPLHFLLARVEGSFNAIHIKADAAGSLFFHGRGAGDLPTASAVLADLLAIARKEAPNNTGFFTDNLPKAPRVDLGEELSSYYVRMMVEDCPGVLRDIAGCLAEEQISMSQVVQRQDALDGQDHSFVPLVFMTHETTAKAMQAALKRVYELKLPKEPIVTFRVLS
ncbi:MAG: homoserine dehydrogenase [Desulfovibrionaceae bacterium]|nr:homoserine dehydrogenase [Desulfovibrionaceae bacterium]